MIFNLLFTIYFSIMNYSKVELSILNKTEQETLDILKSLDLNYIHIDIMDGYFVKNLANITPFFLKKLNIDNWSYKFHLHFMVERVDIFFWYYDFLKNIDSVSFHIESDFYNEKWKVLEFINYLKNKGIKVWLVLNPDTKVSKLLYDDIEPLKIFDFILLMTVYPWKWWQKFITEMKTKIVELRNVYDGKILIDGWVNNEIYQNMGKFVDRFIMWSYLYKYFKNLSIN